MLTGDARRSAEGIGAQLGITRVSRGAAPRTRPPLDGHLCQRQAARSPHGGRWPQRRPAWARVADVGFRDRHRTDIVAIAARTSPCSVAICALSPPPNHELSKRGQDWRTSADLFFAFVYNTPAFPLGSRRAVSLTRLACLARHCRLTGAGHWLQLCLSCVNERCACGSFRQPLAGVLAIGWLKAAGGGCSHDQRPAAVVALCPIGYSTVGPCLPVAMPNPKRAPPLPLIFQTSAGPN